MDFEVFERTSKTKRNQFDPQCLKITQNVPLNFLISVFSANFCAISSDLSGNTV